MNVPENEVGLQLYRQLVDGKVLSVEAHVWKQVQLVSTYTFTLTTSLTNYHNKSAQSNYGRGRCRCGSKSPLLTMARPKIRLKKYPFPWTDLQTPLCASSLDPSDLWCQTASGSDLPFFHNALDRPTHRPMHQPTHWQTDSSSTGKFDDYRLLCL